MAMTVVVIDPVEAASEEAASAEAASAEADLAATVTATTVDADSADAITSWVAAAASDHSGMIHAIVLSQEYSD